MYISISKCDSVLDIKIDFLFSFLSFFTVYLHLYHLFSVGCMDSHELGFGFQDEVMDVLSDG